ncbi:rhodanese-like domain-containing protein [Verrucomicrobiaceae bacterium N1E253]|uniref:Rhodanese-like domain-containing protein n=1 Tax=Oceaniferula marina TaxID=2748318 RepID=A0A851GLK4_9BACT|nr:rhodanese-like domain-containing protein [Oceaniferula marina]NWK55024.1 rhodanese-like domain-containing protein [Oceaniferula marina]
MKVQYGMACLLSLILLSACGVKRDLKGAGRGAEVQHVDVLEAAKLIDPSKEITVIDVRTPDEFVSGAIEGARNLDVQSASFKQQVEALDREKPYLIYCRSGNRSSRALTVFQEAGFTHLYHLEGGIKAWNKAGLPLKP